MNTITAIFWAEAQMSPHQVMAHQLPRVHRTGHSGEMPRGTQLAPALEKYSQYCGQGGTGRRSWVTLSISGALCTLWAWGLRRLWCRFLSLRARGLVHLWGLATDWGTLCNRVRFISRSTLHRGHELQTR
jgi:hypothetical protein